MHPNRWLVEYIFIAIPQLQLPHWNRNIRPKLSCNVGSVEVNSEKPNSHETISSNYEPQSTSKEHFPSAGLRLALTEQVSPAGVDRLLMEKRRKDLLLRRAKLRSGDTALSNRPPPRSPPPPSLSSSSLSSEVRQTRSRAPCKERRTLPTQPATCSWAADSFPPKYCMAEELTQLPVDTPGSPWKLGHRGRGRKKFAFVLRLRVSHGAAFHILGVGGEQVSRILHKKFPSLFENFTPWHTVTQSFIWMGFVFLSSCCFKRHTSFLEKSISCPQ